MAIYLIRHGETPSNRSRVVQVPETPLSDRGVAQAERMAVRLAHVGITRILASDLARASMTAVPLQAATGAPLEYDPDLQERNFGDLRGTPYAELADRGIELFAPGYAPPGGESWSAFHRRVDRAFERVRAIERGEEGHLAVVTHGLVLHSIAARLVVLPAALAPADGYGHDAPVLHFGNTAVTIAAPGPSEILRVELFACTAHLEGEVADDGTALSGL